MRLDKFISQSLGLSRSQSRVAIKQGRVMLNQEVLRSFDAKVVESDLVSFDRKSVVPATELYIALNKPAGFICSNIDEAYPSALNLLVALSPHQRNKLHFAGRLDVDTTGLCLITSDGQFSHRVTAPSRDCDKRYLVTCADKLTTTQIEQLTQGVLLHDETKPVQAKHILPLSDNLFEMTISEGRYHQVKRMLAAAGNHVVKLHRLAIGEIECDGLAEGEWRILSDLERSLF